MKLLAGLSNYKQQKASSIQLHRKPALYPSQQVAKLLSLSLLPGLYTLGKDQKLIPLSHNQSMEIKQK